jgi:gas vesicle protein
VRVHDSDDLVGGLMNNSRDMAATIVGAVIGGVAGYLFFTQSGRSARRQIETALEDVSRELLSFRNTVQKAAGVANEGWKLLNDAFDERGKPQARYLSGQTSPFGGQTYAR